MAMAIAVLRERDGEFEPQFFGKHQENEVVKNGMGLTPSVCAEGHTGKKAEYLALAIQF